MGAVDFGSVLNFGDITVGIDPGSRSLGACILAGDGSILRTWTFRTERDGLERLAEIHGFLLSLFSYVLRKYGRNVLVAIEDGYLRDRPNGTVVSALHGEIRGICMSVAWQMDFRVRKVVPRAWKNKLTDAEREMKKNNAYVEYWRTKTGYAKFKSPDEVDAAMVAGVAAKVQA